MSPDLTRYLGGQPPLPRHNPGRSVDTRPEAIAEALMRPPRPGFEELQRALADLQAQRRPKIHQQGAEAWERCVARGLISDTWIQDPRRSFADEPVPLGGPATVLDAPATPRIAALLASDAAGMATAEALAWEHEAAMAPYRLAHGQVPAERIVWRVVPFAMPWQKRGDRWVRPEKFLFNEQFLVHDAWRALPGGMPPEAIDTERALWIALDRRLGASYGEGPYIWQDSQAGGLWRQLARDDFEAASRAAQVRARGFLIQGAPRTAVYDRKPWRLDVPGLRLGEPFTALPDPFAPLVGIWALGYVPGGRIRCYGSRGDREFAQVLIATEAPPEAYV